MDRSALRAIFPKTLEILQEKQLALLPEQFGRTVLEELAIPPSQDSSLWFPVFLKVQGVSQDVLEIAEFEYLRHSVLQEEDFKSAPLAETTPSTPLCLNPSVQFVELHHDQPRLGRCSGLYCFLKSSGRFFEFHLGLEQALAVDILHEERQYTVQQLAEMANLHSLGQRHSVERWLELIQKMLAMGLLEHRIETNTNLGMQA